MDVPSSLPKQMTIVALLHNCLPKQLYKSVLGKSHPKPGFLNPSTTDVLGQQFFGGRWVSFCAL